MFKTLFLPLLQIPADINTALRGPGSFAESKRENTPSVEPVGIVLARCYLEEMF